MQMSMASARGAASILFVLLTLLAAADSDSKDLEAADGDEERSKRSYVGIPVPGQTVNGLDILTLYTKACQQRSNANDILSNAVNFLGGRQSDEIAQQTYGNLFYNLGEVDLSKLTGKWYKVVDSINVHNEACGVSYVNLIYNSTYLATLTTRDYFREQNAQGEIRSAQGFINKIGPDAGEIHFYTGRDSDPCPYMLIKAGPLDKYQRYEYLVLTQLLKHPVLVLARDPNDFDAYHKEEMKRFLEDNSFYNSLTRQYGMITFLDHKDCPDSFYYHLE